VRCRDGRQLEDQPIFADVPGAGEDHDPRAPGNMNCEIGPAPGIGEHDVTGEVPARFGIALDNRSRCGLTREQPSRPTPQPSPARDPAPP